MLRIGCHGVRERVLWGDAVRGSGEIIYLFLDGSDRDTRCVHRSA